MFGQNSATSSSGLFGQKPTGLFGATTQQTTSPFGQSPQSQQQSTAFGGGGGLFGSTAAKPAFGQTSQQSSGLFGKTPSTFGSTAPPFPAFGTTTTTQAGTSSIFGNAPVQNAVVPYMPVGTTLKFDPLKSTDTMIKNNETKQIQTKHMCMTAMKSYESKSLEELRIEDYLANRKFASTASAGGTSSLFGTNQQTPFGATSQPATSSIFGTAQTQTKTGLFSVGSTAQTPFGTTTSQPATSSIFGSTQTQPVSGLFGQTSAASSSGLFSQKPTGLFTTQQTSPFGQPQQQQQQQPTAFGGGGLFNPTAAKPPFGQTTQSTTGSLFGKTPSTFGNPTPSFPAFGTTTTTQSGTTSLFGNTAGTGAAVPISSTGGGLFSKPGGIFGQTQPTATPFGTQLGQQQQPTFGSGGGLFSKPSFGQPGQQSGSLFGPTPAPAFGSNSAPAFGTMTPGITGGSPPIYLGSNVNVSAMQHAIIDAQLSALPYGDSPLLKSPPLSPERTSLQSLGSLQRKLRYTGSKAGLVLNGSTLTTASTELSPRPASQKSSSTSNGGDLSALNMDNISLNFSYKPLVVMPSVGFGAALGLDTSSSHQQTYLSSPGVSKTKAFSKALRIDDDFTQAARLDTSSTSTTANGGPRLSLSKSRPFSKALQLDDSSPVSFDISSSAIATPPQHLSKIRTSEASQLEEVSSPATPDTSAAASVTTPSRTSTKSLPEQKKPGIRLTRLEYYCEPSIEELNEVFKDGVCHIDSGLTVGRFGYGSVFWRGPFEVHDTDLDEVVHFRNKEVIVYPDENAKPEIGNELNRSAEVSLERIWPVGKDKRIIKDPDELRRLGFRDKLDRLCLRMGATFRDYKPATGTWQFAVDHFSKYGFLEDEEDGDASGIPPQSDEERRAFLKQQMHLQSLVQKANIPFREIQQQQTIEDEFSTLDRQKPEGKQHGTLKRTMPKIEYGYDDEDSQSEDVFMDEDKSSFIDNKKFRLDDTLLESSKMLKRVTFKNVKEVMDKDLATVALPKRLVERQPINTFKGLSPFVLEHSVLKTLRGAEMILPLRSCRVGFTENLAFVSPSHNSHSTTINLSILSINLTVENYFTNYLKSTDSIDRLAQIRSSELLRFDPPSTLTRLVDAFITEIFNENNGLGSIEKRDRSIRTLCSIILAPVSQLKEAVHQRTQLGSWLKNELEMSLSRSLETDQKSGFFTVYQCLVNGAVQEAIQAAQNARLYNFSLLIALYKTSTPKSVRDKLVRQLASSKKNQTDEFYEKVLLLLSGPWTDPSAASKCLKGLHWLQALGVIVWYWAKPADSLLQCLQTFERLVEQKVITIDGGRQR